MNFHMFSAYNSEISSEFREKIRNCPNTPNWPRKKFGIVRILRMTPKKISELSGYSELTPKKKSELSKILRIKVGNYHPDLENIVRFADKNSVLVLKIST
jgi:hypothetical protein